MAASGHTQTRSSVSYPTLATGLPAMTQEVIGQHAGEHGLPDRHGADAHARVMAALGRDLRVLVRRGYRAARRQDGRGGLDGKARHYRIAVRDAAQNAAGVVGEKIRPAIAGP